MLHSVSAPLQHPPHPLRFARICEQGQQAEAMGLPPGFNPCNNNQRRRRPVTPPPRPSTPFGKAQYRDVSG